MDFMSLFDLLILPAIGLVAGKYLKTQPWYDNKFIPIGNLAVIVFCKVVTVLGLTVAQAHAADAPVLGVLALTWKSFGVGLLKAVLSMLLATGTHSALKNTGEGLNRV